MNITYDPVADALNIVFRKGRVAETKEVSEGILLDVDKKENPLYLEVLDASKRFKQPKQQIKRSAKKFSSPLFVYQKYLHLSQASRHAVALKKR